MKNIISFILAIALLALLAACGGTNESSSESIAISSSPESPSEQSEPPSFDMEAELRQQFDEIKNAVKDLTPTAGLGQNDWDDALEEQAQAAIAALGYPVFIYQKDMPNYERVTDFFDKIKDGENAYIAVYRVSAIGGVNIAGDVYEKDDAGFSRRNISVGEEQELSNPYPLKNIVLTEHGNLIVYEADEDTAGESGMRVLPLPKEYREAYEKYIRLVDVQADGILINAWNREAGFRELPWEFIFEEIWERENKKILIAKDNPYYTQVKTDYGEDYVAVVPSDVVESTLQKYFVVDAATLREMTDPYGIGNGTKLYNPDDNTYTIWGFRGGGYKPTVEVWGISNSPDGSISLDLANVALEFGDDGKIYSTLTVMPQADGSFKYISNIFSEDTIREKVEYTLSLAKGADMIYQGGFETMGESIEKQGYHFAAVDIDKLYQDKMKLGGLSSTDSIKRWFNKLFEKEVAEKYIRQIFDAPLYIDGTKDGEEELFVNQDIKGSPIAQGVWVMEDFAVRENTPDRITVQMRFDTADGPKVRALTLVPGERRSWVLTDSYEGLQE